MATIFITVKNKKANKAPGALEKNGKFSINEHFESLRARRRAQAQTIPLDTGYSKFTGLIRARLFYLVPLTYSFLEFSDDFWCRNTSFT